MRCRPWRLVHRTHDTWSSSVSDSASGSFATHTKPSTSEIQTVAPGNKRDACRYALMLGDERAVGLNHFGSQACPTPHTPGTHLGHTWDTPGTHMGHTWDTPSVPTVCAYLNQLTHQRSTPVHIIVSHPGMLEVPMCDRVE
jgi:hypothetical protein